MHPQVVLTSSAPSISLLDYNTGTVLGSWKPTNSNARCTGVIPTRNGLGGVILAVQPDKPLLHAFAFQKDQMLQKMVLPEKFSVLAVDNSAAYCAGGTHTGRIYLWELASGLLLNTFDAHYRQVTALRFSPDSAALFSGSEDSGMAVWSMSRLLDNAAQNDMPTPFWTLTDHTLAITDIQCGVGIFPTYRLFSSSLDGSVKMWDVASRELLGTWSFPTPIDHIAIDPAERAVYASASGDRGLVYQCDLYSHGPGHHTARALVGAGETLHMASDDQSERLRSFAVGKPVTSIALDIPGTQLLAGASDGSISIFDVASHQLLRTISPSTQTSPGPVTFMCTMLRPPDLVGPASTASKDALPLRPLATLHRIRDKAAREAHEVPLVLPKSSLPLPPYTRAAILRDHAAFLQPGQEEDPTALAAEVARLKEQLAQAKGINDSMWQAAVQAALVPTGAAAANAGTEKGAKRQKVGP